MSNINIIKETIYNQLRNQGLNNEEALDSMDKMLKHHGEFMVKTKNSEGSNLFISFYRKDSVEVIGGYILTVTSKRPATEAIKTCLVEDCNNQTDERNGYTLELNTPTTEKSIWPEFNDEFICVHCIEELRSSDPFNNFHDSGIQRNMLKRCLTAELDKK